VKGFTFRRIAVRHSMSFASFWLPRLPIFRGKRICQAPAIRRKSASREVASGGQRKRRAMSGLSQIAEFERRPARGRNQKSNFARATDPPGDLRCPIYNCVYKGLSLTDRI